MIEASPNQKVVIHEFKALSNAKVKHICTGKGINVKKMSLKQVNYSTDCQGKTHLHRQMDKH